MNYKIEPYDKGNIDSPISGVLHQAIFGDKKALNFILGDISVCCRISGEIRTLFRNKSGKYCFLLDSGPDESYVFFIINFLDPKILRYSTMFRLLDIGRLVPLDQNLMNDLLLFFNLPVYKKGMDYLSSFTKTSTLLKKMIDDKKISLKEGLFFHDHFLAGYDDFLKMIPEKLTFAQTGAFVRDITEYSKKNNRTIKDIVPDFKNIDPSGFLDRSRSLRYPLYEKYKKKFGDFIRTLNLPGGVKAEFDDNFEKQDYRLVVNFNDLDSLEKRTGEILKVIDKFKKNNGADLFKFSELFREYFRDEPE